MTTCAERRRRFSCRCGSSSEEGSERRFSRRSTDFSLSSCSSSCSSCAGGRDWRLVVIGAGGVGKTALVSQYLNGVFSAHYTPTVEDSYVHLVQLPDGTFYNIRIVDTAGYHQFPAMRDLSISNGHSFAVVFSIDQHASFIQAKELLHLIEQKRGYCGVPVVLVGNKRDLVNERQVLRDEACELAAQYGCPYIESSARDNINVQHMFVEVVSQNFGAMEAAEKEGKKKPSLTRRISSSFNMFKRKGSDDSAVTNVNKHSCVIQ